MTQKLFYDECHYTAYFNGYSRSIYTKLKVWLMSTLWVTRKLNCFDYIVIKIEFWNTSVLLKVLYNTCIDKRSHFNGFVYQCTYCKGLLTALMYFRIQFLLQCNQNSKGNVSTVINIHWLFWLVQCKSIASGADIVYLLIYKIYNHENSINKTCIQKHKFKIYTNSNSCRNIFRFLAKIF